jgi:hypothetical protein
VYEGPNDKAATYLSMIRKRATRFFGSTTGLTGTGVTTHKQEYKKFGTEFTPTGVLEFDESKNVITTSKENIKIDFSKFDINVGVPIPKITGAVTALRTAKPAIDYTNLYITNKDVLKFMTYEQFALELWNEYDYELFWEGSRLFDYYRKRRLNTLPTLTTKVTTGRIQPYHYLLPFPANEMSTNTKLVQNPGY